MEQPRFHFGTPIRASSSVLVNSPTANLVNVFVFSPMLMAPGLQCVGRGHADELQTPLNHLFLYFGSARICSGHEQDRLANFAV